ncbi:MAG: AMP-binding protein [Candidatus Heimdallarchaeota archaeon]
MARWKYHKEIPNEFPIPDKDLIEVFYESVQKSGDLPFLIFQDRVKSFNQSWNEVVKFANVLSELGIKKGDRVAIYMPNCPQFVISYLSTLYLGGIVTALSSLYTEKEIQFQLKDSGSKVLVTLDLFLEKVRKVRKKTDLNHVIVSSVADELGAVKGFLYRTIINRKSPKPNENELIYKDLMKNAKEKDLKAKIDPKNDLACLQYTGGTTGVPKAAMLTHTNLLSNAMTIHYWEWWVGGPQGKQLNNMGALPLSHIFGLTTSFMWPLYSGGMVVLIPDPRKLEEIMKAIEKWDIHFFCGVPTLYQKMAMHPAIAKYDYSSLRGCISGGSALHQDTMDIFEGKTDTILVEGYGLSEAAPVTHINPADKKLRKPGIGIPIPNTEAKIIHLETGDDITDFDKKGFTTPEGELVIKGPQVMKGYWNRQDETDKVFTKDGWLKTGDVVHMTKDGFFNIVDRLKDCIFTSGFQVWPLEVETALIHHPEISMAAVIPVKDENVNEVIKAVLVAEPGSKQYSHAELKAYCKKHLAPYKVPKYFEYREELPLSPVGKVLRRPLREEAEKVAVKAKK